MLLDAVEAALHKDDVGALGGAVQAHALHIDAFYDCQDAKHGPQQRDLLSLAAAAGAQACVAALLAAGADPNARSPSDGNSALHCACSSANSSTARVVAVLVRGGADKLLRNAAGLTPCDLLSQETSQPASADAPPPEDSDLLRPEYSTDDFRMFSFKIDCCPRLAESHDWTLCPFQHPGEKARRRDPRCFKYHGVPCPDFRKGTCKRGDACTYAHGVFECWLHPSRYRTQLCKEGAACRRSVCFFAHSVEQLREPTMLPKPAGSTGPSSPRGPLLPAEESEDTPRSWSPAPAGSEDSVRLAGSTESLPRGCLLAPAAHRTGRRSADSSLSSTPVLESAMSVSFGSESALQRTLSSLSLCSDDRSQAAALQQHVAAGMPAHAALLAASAAAHWPLPVAHSDALGALLAGGPLSLHGLGGGLLPDVGAVQAAVQAAGVQQQLALLQAQAQAQQAADASLLAAAGVRQPLHPLSLNLGHTHYHHAPPTTAPSCLSLGL